MGNVFITISVASMLKFRCTVSKSNSSNAWEHSRSVVFRPTLLPDLSALLSPLKPEVTSLIRRPRGDRQLGGTSTLSGSCNNGWKRRRCRASQRRTLDGNRLHCAATDNGTVRRRYAAFTPDKCSPDTSCIDLYPLVSASRTLLRTPQLSFTLIHRSTATDFHVCVSPTLGKNPATRIWCKRGFSTFFPKVGDTQTWKSVAVDPWIRVNESCGV